MKLKGHFILHYYQKKLEQCGPWWFAIKPPFIRKSSIVSLKGFFKSKFGKENALTQTEEEQTGVLFLHF